MTKISAGFWQNKKNLPAASFARADDGVVCYILPWRVAVHRLNAADADPAAFAVDPPAMQVELLVPDGGDVGMAARVAAQGAAAAAFANFCHRDHCWWL